MHICINSHDHKVSAINRLRLLLYSTWSIAPFAHATSILYISIAGGSYRRSDASPKSIAIATDVAGDGHAGAILHVTIVAA